MIEIFTSIILPILTVLFGGSSIISFILYRKQNKKLKDLEVKKEEIDTDSIYIDNLSKVNDEWQEALTKCDEDKAYYRSLVKEKDETIAKLNREMFKLQEEKQFLELQNQQLEFSKCTRFNCVNRIPPSAIFGDSQTE